MNQRIGKEVYDMAVLFSESKTKENLMRAFAGESQARNRYTFAAERANREGMKTIGDIFLYTADQERAHAQCFYQLLNGEAGKTITIEGGYPVDEQGSIIQLLQAAVHNEQEEAGDVYPAFAEMAKQEGFFEAAAIFQQIADIEAVHGKRFQMLVDWIKNNIYYMCGNTDETRKWICTNCGHIYEGRQAPGVCPICRHPQGYFLPYELACYVIGREKME